MSNSLEELRAQVLQTIACSVGQPEVATDWEEGRLQRRLDALRYRIGKKEATLQALQTQQMTLQKEQQTTCPPDQFFQTQSFSASPSTNGEFSVSRLWSQRERLQKEIEAIAGKIDAEELQTEQMSYLLHSSKQATKAAGLRTEQLRYLQKRLLRRHEEIVTMKTRAENEYIHANYSSVKSTQSAVLQSARLQASLSHKRQLANSLKSEVEQASEMVAMRQLQRQETQIRTKRATALLAKVDAEHKEAVALQGAHSLSVKHAKNALKLIEKYSGDPGDGDVDVKGIVAAFQGLQFQNTSLNERFSELSEQANRLRLHCEDLQSQLAILHDSESASFGRTSALRGSSEFTTYNQMRGLLDKEDDLKGLEKTARDSEEFALTLVLNCQEIMRKLNSYLGFVAAQSDGHFDSFAVVFASQVAVEGLGERVQAKGRSKTNIRSKERGSVAVSREEGAASLTRLREDLSQSFRRRLVEQVVETASHILPVRACPELFTGREWNDELTQWKGQEQNSAFALQILGFLVAESNVFLQRKAADVLKTLAQLIQSVSDSRNELKSQVQSQHFTSEQKQAFLQAKADMHSRVQSLPLSNLPDKLRHTLATDFTTRIQTLAGLRTERSVRTDPLYSEDSEREESGQEKEEIAMLSEERKIQRLGLSVRKKAQSGEGFVPEKIASLSAIRRVAELEKKLLEQVQGVELKLKRVKSRERKLRVPLLPAISRSSSTLRLQN